MDVYQIAEIPSNNVVTNKDVERLTQNRWLNDTCMNAITHLISLDFPRVKTDSSPCYHVMDTAFFTLLTGIDGEKAYDHHAIKGFTQNTKMAYAPFDCQKIFVPLNIDNMHWALLIVELFPPDRVNLYTYDSLNVVRNVHENITQWVHDEVRARPQWDAEELQIQSIVMHVSQRQTNSYDCGMYVLFIKTTLKK